jgi:hypothetical protein
MISVTMHGVVIFLPLPSLLQIDFNCIPLELIEIFDIGLEAELD